MKFFSTAALVVAVFGCTDARQMLRSASTKDVDFSTLVASDSDSVRSTEHKPLGSFDGSMDGSCGGRHHHHHHHHHHPGSFDGSIPGWPGSFDDSFPGPPPDWHGSFDGSFDGPCGPPKWSASFDDSFPEPPPEWHGSFDSSVDGSFDGPCHGHHKWPGSFDGSLHGKNRNTIKDVGED